METIMKNLKNKVLMAAEEGDVFNRYWFQERKV
jgi:hypothetical protein